MFQVSRPYLGFCSDPKHFIVNSEQNVVRFAGKWGKMCWKMQFLYKIFRQNKGLCWPTIPSFCRAETHTYRNDPKFSDRYAWANSTDPDQTLIRVYTVCNSVHIVWNHYSMAEPHSYSSNFRVITTNILGVRIFRKCTVFFFCFFLSKETCLKCFVPKLEL